MSLCPTAINVWFSYPKDFVQKDFGSTCRGKKNPEQEVSIQGRNLNIKGLGVMEGVQGYNKKLNCIFFRLHLPHRRSINMICANILIIPSEQSSQGCSPLVSWHLCVYGSHPFHLAPKSNKVSQDPAFSEPCHSPKTEGGREWAQKVPWVLLGMIFCTSKEKLKERGRNINP